MSIKTWPQQQQPREKLLHSGAKSLSDAELIAIFLRTGTFGKNAVELGQDLLSEFGSLRRLLASSPKTLTQIKGLGTSKYIQLQAALELGKRYLHEAIQRETVLTNPATTKAYLTSQLRDREQEIFAVLFLDIQYQVLAFEELFFGSISGTTVHPREVVKRALYHNAAAVILAHNHPSGIAKASDHDIAITKTLKQALDLIDVSIVDHFIVGDGQVVSFATEGLL